MIQMPASSQSIPKKVLSLLYQWKQLLLPSCWAVLPYVNTCQCPGLGLGLGNKASSHRPSPSVPADLRPESDPPYSVEAELRKERLTSSTPHGKILPHQKLQNFASFS